MTVVSTIGPPARCSQAEVKGFLLDYTNLSIMAEPGFFCPLTGSALISASYVFVKGLAVTANC